MEAEIFKEAIKESSIRTTKLHFYDELQPMIKAKKLPVLKVH